MGVILGSVTQSQGKLRESWNLYWKLLKDNNISGTTTTTTSVVSTAAQTQQENVLTILFISFFITSLNLMLNTNHIFFLVQVY